MQPSAAFKEQALYCTTSVTVLECVKLPLVPVIVKTKLPVWVLRPVCTLRVLFPEPVTEPGLKLAVVWFGNPLMLKLTAPLKPPEEPTVTV